MDNEININGVEYVRKDSIGKLPLKYVDVKEYLRNNPSSFASMVNEVAMMIISATYFNNDDVITQNIKIEHMDALKIYLATKE